MQLQRFMSDHPDCRVIRADLILPSLFVLLPTVTCAFATWRASDAVSSQQWIALLLWMLLGGIAAAPLRRTLHRLREVMTAHKRGHAAIAIADEDVLMIDSAGNAVVVALARVTRLELEGREARLRTDSDLQGIVYAIAFNLFDGDAPGPSAALFFDALAPRLRERVPEAVIVRYD